MGLKSYYKLIKKKLCAVICGSEKRSETGRIDNVFHGSERYAEKEKRTNAQDDGIC